MQNLIKGEVLSFIKQKIKTKVDFKEIYLSFSGQLVIEDLFAEDRSRDTLLFARTLAVDANIHSLLDRKIQLNSVRLESALANIGRSKDSKSFNFDYIAESFSNGSTDTTSSKWSFDIDLVKISDTRFKYHDFYAGNVVDLDLGDLVVDVDHLDLEKSIYHIESVNISNTSVEFDQRSTDATLNAPGNQQSNTLTPDFNLHSLQLENSRLIFDNENQGVKITVLANQLNTKVNKIDLEGQSIDLSSIELSESFVSYQKLKVNQNTETSTQSTTNTNWKVNLKELRMSGNGFQYYAYNSSKSKAQFDPNRLWLYQINTTANNIRIDGLDVEASIQNLSFNERSGLSILSFKSDVKLLDNVLKTKALTCVTNNSKLNLNSEISLDEFFKATPDIGKVNINTNVNNTTIGFSDIAFFIPKSTLDSLPIHISRHMKINLNASISGKIEYLTITELKAKTLSKTDLLLSGTVTGLPSAKRAKTNLIIDYINTTKSDVEGLLSPIDIKSKVNIPERIQLKGTLKGLIQSPSFTASLNSSDGYIQVDGALNFAQSLKYDVAIQTKELMVGEILMMPTLGRISMDAKIKGKGTSLKTIDTNIDLKASRIVYNSYEYKNFDLHGNLNKYGFSGDAEIDDRNLSFQLKSRIERGTGERTLCKANLRLRNVDFQELRLSRKALKARGSLAIEFASDYEKDIFLKMSIADVTLFNGKKLYQRDSLLYVGINQDTLKSNITIRSEVLSGGFQGSFDLFRMPEILKRHLNRYFSLYDSTIHKPEKRQYFKFNFVIRNSELLNNVILPDLKPFLPGDLHGEFDSNTNLLTVEADLAKLQYGMTSVDSVSLKIKSDRSAFKYSLNLRRIGFDTLQINGIRIRGRIENDSIRTALIVLDSLDKRIYTLVADVQSKRGEFKIHLLPERVVLNRENWTIPADNYLLIRGVSIRTKNFSFTRDSQQFELLAHDSTMLLRFKQFQLSNITRVFEGIVPAEGRLNGEIKLSSSAGENLNSDLAIHELKFLGREWGDAVIGLKHSNHTYDAKFDVHGTQMNLKTTASYNTATQAYSGNLTIDPFDMALVESFSLHELNDVHGTLNGDLNFFGSMKKPSIPTVDGKITFSNTSMVITRLKTRILLKDETVSFNKGSLSLSDFRVNDVNDNLMLVNGTIHRDEYSPLTFNLSVHANAFEVLNTTKKDNELCYGLLKLDASAKITGDINSPKVKTSLKVTDDSNITYVVPETERTISEQKGIVKFVSKNKQNDPFLKDIQDSDTTQLTFLNLTLSGDLTLRDNATLNIVIDPVTEDKLSVNGNSTLLFEMNGSGNMNLSGRYEVTKGFYNFSFHNMAKRQFVIEKGGSIVWSGDPMNAAIDLKASYQLETSPLDLVYNQINTTNQSELNAYNQRLPFIVYLILQGKLLTPQINFLLDMPDNKRNVLGGAIYAKLQDINTRESDLNKQVFALMILKRFLSDTPFESKTGSGLNNTARASVSRILSEQLNRLSENVKGVKLDVDIKSYENYTGTEVQGQTKLQLGVSKTLLNDRLVVKLSGNVDVEGQKSENTSASDYIGDLALEYKLTSDGRLRITGFRNSNFDVIDGGLTETGAGLIYIKDYNTLKELFRANAKEK